MSRSNVYTTTGEHREIPAQDCGSEEHCVSACPENAIYMAGLSCQGNKDPGTWRIPAPEKESCQDASVRSWRSQRPAPIYR